MFLFLDTSALVKAYVLERGTEAVHEQLRRADEIAISVLAVVEFCAALSRKVREGALTSAQRNDLTGDLLLDGAPRNAAYDTRLSREKFGGDFWANRPTWKRKPKGKAACR